MENGKVQGKKQKVQGFSKKVAEEMLFAQGRSHFILVFFCLVRGEFLGEGLLLNFLRLRNKKSRLFFLKVPGFFGKVLG